MLICIFSDRNLRQNEVIVKTNNKFGLFETRQIIYYLKDLDNSYPKTNFLLNFSHFVKSFGHLCQILACFAMITHQIWSSHQTQIANFENFNFSLILHQILEKSQIFWSISLLVQTLSGKDLNAFRLDSLKLKRA